MTDVFISYSRKNKSFVQKLFDAFEKEGKKAWVDWEGIPHGSEWWREIEVGIESSDSFIFVISPDSIASEICERELIHALESNKRLVPILYQDVKGEIPPDLAKLDWIFFRDSDDFDKAFAALLETLNTDLEHVRAHTRLLTRAIEWENRNNDHSLLLRGNDLNEAQQWLMDASEKQPAPTSLQMSYITQGAQRQAKNQKRRLFIIGAGLVISIALAIFANQQRLFAIQQRNQATLSNIESLASLSGAQLASHDELLSLLSAVKSARKFLDAENLSRKATFQEKISTLRKKVGDILHETIYTTQERNRLEFHKDKVQSIKFSADGQFIVSGSSDHEVNVWRVNGQLLRAMKHEGSVYAVDISADSQYIISGSADHTAKLWNVQGELINTFQHEDVVSDVHFSPDGQLIATACADDTVKIWQRDGQLLHNLVGHTGDVLTIAFSPDNKILASGGSDRAIKLWEVATGNLKATLKGHMDRVYKVIFHPTETLLASGSADNTIKVWQVGNSSPTLLFSVLAHENWVYDIAFNPNGKTVASTSASGSVKLWSTDGTLLKVFESPGIRVRSISFSHDGKFLAAARGDATIRMYSLESGHSVKILAGHTSGLKDVDYSPDGKILASSATDGTIRLWDSQTFSLRDTIETGVSVRDVDFVLPEGNALGAATYNNTVQFYDLASKNLTKEIPVTGEGSLSSVAFHPKGAFFATAQGSEIGLWDFSGELREKLDPQKKITSLSFSRDGQLLAAGTTSGITFVWDSEGQVKYKLEGHESWINNLAFSTDNQYLATASSDNTIKLWQLSDGTLSKTLKGHTDWVWDVSFYPNSDTKILISGAADNTIKIWDYAKGTLEQTLKLHDGWVRSVDFNVSGTEIASASSDKTVIVWDFVKLQKYTASSNTVLPDLFAEGCQILHDYLTYNPKVQPEDRKICSDR